MLEKYALTPHDCMVGGGMSLAVIAIVALVTWLLFRKVGE
jgi:hypothetical protein